MNVFNEIDKFFSSLKNYIELNEIFLIFIGLFLFTIFVVIISTSRSYEARLIKSIDMLNNYFIDNPQITEDNLVPFNTRMKSKKVPKQLRKQWQQFVLYREKKASEYMSFDACVSIPIRNSTYKRDLGIMNAISWILATLSLVVNMYMVLSTEISVILRQSFLTPAIIILLNIIVRIFLDMRHNAIISDLNQNYQYFEVNIDKATETLPEYVDYEVLFDRNEIKRGIPMLYAYLQKRAEMEKKELERARLKNVHHEKFNFDEAGVESSLVLERAMQEAENYISERKKLMQDMEQINGDITQEEMNFREITKEYQRQMQVSKETFDNFKSQLDEASSTIEINYLKKQQQQELDRQRNLERDYDTATDRHKKVLNSYQEELTGIENEIKKARKTLERGMLSEFDSYSGKVYDAAVQVVETREKEKTNKLKSTIKQLEERLVAKDAELEGVYNQNQNLNNQLSNQMGEYRPNYAEPTQYTEPIENPTYAEDNLAYAEDAQYTQPQEEEQDYNYLTNEDNNQETFEDNNETFNYLGEAQENEADDANNETDRLEVAKDYQEQAAETPDTSEDDEDQGEEVRPELYDAEEGEELDSADDLDFTDPEDESTPKRSVGRPRKVETEEKPKRKAGRPRKVVDEDAVDQPPKRRGRPKKTEQVEDVTPKRKAGRPKKVKADTIDSAEPKKGRGRPKKEVAEVEESNSEPKRGRGRPKKATTEKSVTTEPKKGRGRPRKDSNDLDAYIQELDDEIAKESAKMAESEKALEQNSKISKK